MTFDDLPSAYAGMGECSLADADETTGQFLAMLAPLSVTVTAFINEGRCRHHEREAIVAGVVRAWHSAGHSIGNHTATHPSVAAGTG